MNHSGSDGVEERMEEEGLGNSGRLDFKGCFCYGKMSEESPQNPAAHSPTLATPDEEKREKTSLSFILLQGVGALVLSRRAPRA